MLRRPRLWAAALIAFGTGLGFYSFRPAPSAAQQPFGVGGAPVVQKYTVVETEGTNLLVVDNSTHTLFFYTIDPGQEVGAPLHLRGSIDLTHVGKDSITPRTTKKGGKGAAP